MTLFASRLRQRAQELEISNAEAARRAGLSERRYAHYVSGKREPDLATLVRIAAVLGTTPNWLLAADPDDDGAPTPASLLKARLTIAMNTMTEQALKITVVQAEAVASMEEQEPT